MNTCPSCASTDVHQFKFLQDTIATSESVRNAELFRALRICQCNRCGYMAPQRCFESDKKNAEYRLQFPLSIHAESANGAKALLSAAQRAVEAHWTKI